MTETKIIAMWSGPRNLSTAMMRSFGNRADCTAMDEPFYGAYLKASGADHPMREAVMASMERDPDKVAAQCLGPFSTPFSYQKHMPHHMIDGFPMAWTKEVTNVFLLRHPRRILASYAKKKQNVVEADIGYVRMLKVYDEIASMKGADPLVISSEDILADPEGMLTRLCDAVGMLFDPAMLAWEPGPRPEDGVWGEHWYDAIWKSTGFAKPESSALPEIPDWLTSIEAEALPAYEVMAKRKLQPAAQSQT